jgi:tRNA threonylcarbamoyladenosine biosynthesis protein TsaB
MLTLCIRTDKPEAELYLFDGDKKLAELIWLAHKELSNTLLVKSEELLRSSDKSLQDLEKIAVFEGPGSFTGLRIGASMANALAYGLGIPVVTAGGDGWIKDCLAYTDSTYRPVSVVYGSEPHITLQKK